MEKICLLNPPSPFLLDERVFMPLGILRVAAVLERVGHKVDFLDLSGVENYEDVVRSYRSKNDARAYCLTATTPQMPAAVKIRKVLQGCPVVLGGPHVTLVNAAAKKENARGVAGRARQALEELHRRFDCLVAGDGERAIFPALGPAPPPLIDADDPKSDLFLTDQKYEMLPRPARHLLDVGSYRYAIDGVPAMSLIAQLGCPFNCGFCGGRSSPMLRRIRTRSVENIVGEMLHLYDTYGVRGLMFYDDELNVNKDVVKLMKAIRATKIDWKLRGFVKAELFNDEQAEAMYWAGFRWILVGFESGSPRILQNINKKATREDNTNCLHVARKHRLKVKALMSLGHPGESEETVRQTADWLLGQKPNDFDLTVITTYPGTPYYDDAVETRKCVWTYTAKNGDRLHARDVNFLEEASYYKGAPGDYQSFVFTDYLADGRIVRLRDNLERKLRESLNIPYPAASPGVRYEASMGQLPGIVLRRSR